MDVPDVVSVVSLNNFKLLLEFDGGEYRVFDFSEFARSKNGLPKEILSDESLFKKVELDGTGTICWPNDYDLAVEFLYNHSKLIPELSNIS